VHSEFLANQRIPTALVTKRIWSERFEDIRCFERYLGRNGIVVVKFFLHVSKQEQKRRFLERAEEPEKNWKFSGSDMAERDHWAEYQQAYQDMIRNTATKHSPWYVVPADNEWVHTSGGRGRGHRHTGLSRSGVSSGWQFQALGDSQSKRDAIETKNSIESSPH
jgi:hypothetical protein